MNSKFLKLLEIKESDIIFRKCINKIPINKSKFSYLGVVDYQNQIGMIIPNGYTCIDVDDNEAADILKKMLDENKIKCIINKTKNGRHFIFRVSSKNQVKNCVKVFTPIGIEVDTRVSGKGYIILPEGSEKDKRSYEVLPDDIDEIPFWLIPNKDLKIFFSKNSLRLEKGSRDNSIFKYIKILEERTSYTYEEAQEICSLINNYIFKKKMSLKDILNKIDPENFKAGRNQKNEQERYVKIARDIVQTYMIKKYKGDLYFYNGIKYVIADEAKINNIIIKDHDELIPKNKRTEIFRFIIDDVEEFFQNDDDYSKDIVATPSELINLRTLKRIPNDGRYFNRNNISFDFIENIKENKFVDEYMKSLFKNDDEINLVYEMIGYSMLSHLPFRKSFFLIGPAQTGKSFFLDRLKTIFGYDNISATSIDDLDRDPRMAISLKDSLINVPDDLSNVQIENESIFKKCVSGDLIEIDVKYKVPIRFVPSSTFIMTSNYEPKFKNHDNGIYSRLILIKFEKELKRKIANFESKWKQEHYEYIVFKSIKAINKALENGNFSIPNHIQENLTKFTISNNKNNVSFFLEDYEIKDRIPSRLVYDSYKIWCNDNGEKHVSKKIFEKYILDNLNVKIKQTTYNADSRGNVKRYIYD